MEKLHIHLYDLNVMVLVVKLDSGISMQKMFHSLSDSAVVARTNKQRYTNMTETINCLYTWVVAIKLSLNTCVQKILHFVFRVPLNLKTLKNHSTPRKSGIP